ncbi:hypothetical protein EII22_04185 [Coriobacteriales bacterium OH1046]|nr:hypothetical protein EII22_04185 [Coriobacteriales bacterium OH1046]
MTRSSKPGCAPLLILGGIIFVFPALMLLVATVQGVFDRDSDLVIGGLIVCFPMLFTAYTLIRKGLASRSSDEDAGDAPDRGQVVEVETIAGTVSPEYEAVDDRAAALPAAIPVTVPAALSDPAPEPASPAPESGPAPASEPVIAAPEPLSAPIAAEPGPPRTGLYAPEGSQGAYAIEKLVLRSSDVFATLRDFAAHPQAEPYDAALAAMLGAIGIAGWSDAPKIEAVKLGRSDNLWLGSNTDGLSDEDFDRYLGIECALNVNLGMRKRNTTAAEILKSVADLEPLPSKRMLPGIAEGADEGGEWMCRLRFAEFAENIPVPYRLAFGMQANVAERILVIDLTIPRPSSMAFYAANHTGCIAAARAYALRSALLCARKALDLNPSIAQVIVNCGVPRGSGTLLSFDLDRTTVKRLLPALRDASIDASGFPSDPAIRASFDAEGWFQEVEPFCPIDGERVAPRFRHEPVELDGSPASAQLGKACGARTVSDIGINENAGRIRAWNDYADTMGETTGDAVARLIALRNASQDMSIAEAADRVSKALVEGSLDISDKQELGKLFVNGDPLDRVSEHAAKALDDPDHADLPAVLSSLEEALAPITAMGAYLDDSDQVYRYFNSLAERIWFNLNLGDHARRVRLVPDAYYIAHSCAARILSMLDRSEEALAHSDELVRIAPATPDAALVRVRILENMSRIYDAAELLMETIGRCSTVRDLAVCFYRLAYMQWKLGRNDLAAACYERSIMLKTPLAPQAEDELADLLASDEDLKRLSGEETLAALGSAAIPLGDPESLYGLAARAAIATTDGNLHGAAAALTGTLLDMGRDDVLVDVYQSLKISR